MALLASQWIFPTLIVCSSLSFTLFLFALYKIKAIRKEHDELVQINQTLNIDVGVLTEKVNNARLLSEALEQEKRITSELQAQNTRLIAKNEAHTARIDALLQSHEEKLALLHATEEKLTTNFENIATRVLDSNAKKFSDNSHKSLNELLSPFKTELEGFKRQITDQHIREGQERASLKTEILSLKALNQKITEEAAALTLALKGDNKAQGNWGEVVLQRILKESGLREGHEFDIQVSSHNDDGKRYQPDVVVHLPNDKDVIIDSKVSLNAYERYFNSDDQESRKQYLAEHVLSLKNHIKGLGKKAYHQLEGIKTLDYVLLFVPVEPAFLLAIDEDPELVSLALSNNIMLVSPTNLLVALRTINNIWQYEYQNRNAQDIAQHAAKLHDKFVGFVTDFEKVGKSLLNAQSQYDTALNKLATGRGNIVKQVENFRDMGVQTNKSLSATISNMADRTSDE